MPRKPIKFELDFMIKDIFPRFTVKQFDDVSFNIKPLNQGLDYDTSNMIGKIFVGVNNDMFMQTTDITVSSDNINVLLDKNMLQKNGRAYAEIELTDEAGTITSSSFIFDIDPKIGEGGMIPGEYEGFVEKYERLISEFKAQINSSIDNSNNLIDKTIKNCNTSVDTKLSTVDSRLNSKVAEVDNKLNTVDSLVNTKITNINNTLNKKVSEVDSKLDTVDGLITAKVSDFERRFSALTSSQQQNSEVIDAREGEVSLKARLDKDIENPKKLYTSIEGTEISVDSSEGYLKDIEILGNTVQDQDNLADIRSVGDKLENKELYEIPVLCTNGLDSSDSNYKEHKLTILSPTPLEKVGDVADRIICKDGVWGVEKNINTIVFNGSENWRKNVSSATHNRFTIDFISKGAMTDLICDQFPINGDTLTQSTVFIYNGSILIIGVSNDIVENDVNKFKAWLQTNPTTVLYQLPQPTFIPLPYDQQIKLRTFANKTNISFGCEIEPTLKASVPKSLGASVSSNMTQIDNLSKELEKINNLEESVASEVVSESDFITVENTSNGYFEDVKLEGRTLVNLCNNNSIKTFGTLSLIELDTFKLIQEGTSEEVAYVTTMPLLANKEYTIVYNILNNNLSKNSLVLKGGQSNNVVKENIIINNSVGVNCFKFMSNDSGQGAYIRFAISGIEPEGNFVSIQKNIILLEGDHTQNPPEYFEGLKSVGQDVDEISVLSTNKEETKEDKKCILYYNEETQTWEKPILRQWDSIEKHSDGKYYYHVRSEEVPYTEGDETKVDHITDMTTTVKKISTEKVYECTDLDLITYQNETNLVMRSGVLNPKVTLKVKKGIGNVVTMLQNKVAMLEDLVNKLIQK